MNLLLGIDGNNLNSKIAKHFGRAEYYTNNKLDLLIEPTVKKSVHH